MNVDAYDLYPLLNHITCRWSARRTQGYKSGCPTQVHYNPCPSESPIVCLSRRSDVSSKFVTEVTLRMNVRCVESMFRGLQVWTSISRETYCDICIDGLLFSLSFRTNYVRSDPRITLLDSFSRSTGTVPSLLTIDILWGSERGTVTNERFPFVKRSRNRVDP